MPFWRTSYHLVWTTYQRQALIMPEIEARLYAYIIHKAAELGAWIYAINGTEDHLHIVASIPPKIAVADLVKHIKGASSHEMNATMNLPYHFAWQRGYGVLTLGEQQRPQAEAYVQAQKTHHHHGSTNVWLERCPDDEEDAANSNTESSTKTREAPEPYLIDEWPF